MAIDTAAVLGNIQQKTNAAKSELAGTALANDFDSFLLLLTTQLKNQDPTEPLDTNQFTQQLVAFSGVEQSIATNKNLEKLVALASGSQIDKAASYIGRHIDASGDKGVLSGGQGNFAYELPAGATSALVTLTNASGQVVFSGNGTTFAGKNLVTWDGINSFNSQTEAPGVYTVHVKAKDATGKDLEAKTYTTGRVTSVDLKGGNAVLSIGTIEVPVETVVSVRQSAA